MKLFSRSISMVVFLLTLSILHACSMIGTINDYVDKNSVLVNITTSQVVSRYIDAAKTIDDKKERAKEFSRRANKVLEFIDGNPQTTVDGLLLVIDSAIEWDKISYPDKILIGNIVLLIEVELRKLEADNSIDSEERFAIRALFNVAIKTADDFIKGA